MSARLCGIDVSPSSSLQAYLEFFASPEFVALLLDVLKSYPLVNYHIVNKEVSSSHMTSHVIYEVYS